MNLRVGDMTTGEDKDFHNFFLFSKSWVNRIPLDVTLDSIVAIPRSVITFNLNENDSADKVLINCPD